MDSDLKATYLAIVFAILVIAGVIYMTSCTYSVTQLNANGTVLPEEKKSEGSSNCKLPENAIF